MIVEERMTAYLRSLEPEEAGLTGEIARGARQEGIPIIKPETGALLKVLLGMKRPRSVLEVGAAIGYSAIVMAGCLDEEARLTTIECDPDRARRAAENISKAGFRQKIRLIEGDAAQVLPGLDPGFDFIFMDAAKGQYIHFLDQVMRLLTPGAVLVSDNVLRDGDIIQSRFAVRRRDRTIHSRMRRYLWQLKHSQDLETAVLTVGDGVAVSVRKAE